MRCTPFISRLSTHKWFIKNGKSNTFYDITKDIKNYDEFLKTDFWQAQRLKFIKSHFNCYACGIYENLDIHHITYKKMFIQPQLLRLCRKHHFELHKYSYLQRSKIKHITAIFHLSKHNPPRLTTKDSQLLKEMGTIAYFRLVRMNPSMRV